MIAEKPEGIAKSESILRRTWPWLNLLLTAILVGLGAWYLTRRVSLADVGTALSLAHTGYIGLSLFAMVTAIVVKTWRWQQLLTPGEKNPSFPALFWAMAVGQYVNLIVPFFRLGELARVYALDRQTHTGKVRTLSTLVVEKTLDMIMLVLTLVVLLPLIVVPDFVSNSALLLGLIAAPTLLVLYLVAYQTQLVIRISRQFIKPLPAPLRRRLEQLIVSGLEGLAALRDRRLTLTVMGSSAVIAILSVLTPYLLFPALNIGLGLVAAALIHVVVTVAITPPSTPAKIGVFDGAVAFMLVGFGLEEEAVIVSYTLIYHLVVVLPQILLGVLATVRTNWKW